MNIFQIVFVHIPSGEKKAIFFTDRLAAAIFEFSLNEDVKVVERNILDIFDAEGVKELIMSNIAAHNQQGTNPQDN